MTLEYQFMLQLMQLLANQPPSPPQPGLLDEQKLLRSAIYHQIVPLIDYYRPTLQTIFPDLTPEFFQKVRDYTTANQYYIIKVEKLLDELTSAFATADIEYRLFKGIVLARQVYPQPFMRTFGDIDILIQPADLPRVEKLLSELRFVPCTDLYNIYPIEIAQKYHFARHYQHLLPPEIPVDIHLSLSSDLFPYQFPIEDFWAHSQPIVINGKTHLTFELPYQILFALFHAFKHYYFKLIWFCDIYLLQRQIDLASSEFQTLLEQFDLKRLWRFYCYLAQSFFKQNYPQPVRLSAFASKVVSPQNVINGMLTMSELKARLTLPLVYFSTNALRLTYLFRQLFPPREVISDFYGPNPLPPTWSNYWRLRFKALKNLLET